MIKYYIAFGLIGAAVLGAIIYGFTAIGSPFAARDQRLDGIRLQNLSNIRAAIETYSAKNRKLPESLDQLPETTYGYSKKIKDPVTDRPYEYNLKSANEYEVCADFATEAADDQGVAAYDYTYLGDGSSAFKHKKGHDCWAGQIQAYNPPVVTNPMGVEAYLRQDFGNQASSGIPLAATRDTQRLADLKTIQNGLELYYGKQHRYPEGTSSWTALQTEIVSANIGVSTWPRDPLGGEYYYSADKEGKHYVVGTAMESSNIPGSYTGAIFSEGMKFPTGCGAPIGMGGTMYCVTH